MLDPWKTGEVKDYGRIMEEFGIDRFDLSILPEDPAPPRLFSEGIVFGQRGFSSIIEKIRVGDPFAVLTGLMPSGRMHLGHKMVMDQIRYFQNFNSHIVVAVADLEAYATRGMSQEKADYLAVNSYIKNYLAMGLGKNGFEVYFQSKRRSIKELAFEVGKKINLNTMRAIYGFDDSTNMAHMHAPLIQAGDILHPQLKFGPIPVVVPVGIDQDPHIRLCRTLASSFRIFNATKTADGKIGIFVKVDEGVERYLNKARSAMEKLGFLDMKMIPRYKALYVNGATVDDLPRMDEAMAMIEAKDGGYGFLPPASTYHRFIRGLTGEKMSSSKPETAIFLDDEPDAAAKKMMKAITGGKESAEVQRRDGGNPDNCSVFETMLYHTLEDNDDEVERISNECRSGQRLCGQCKKEAAEHLREFLEDLKTRRDETEHLVKEYVKQD